MPRVDAFHSQHAVGPGDRFQQPKSSLFILPKAINGLFGYNRKDTPSLKAARIAMMIPEGL